MKPHPVLTHAFALLVGMPAAIALYEWTHPQAPPSPEPCSDEVYASNISHAACGHPDALLVANQYGFLCVCPRAHRSQDGGAP